METCHAPLSGGEVLPSWPVTTASRDHHFCQTARSGDMAAIPVVDNDVARGPCAARLQWKALTVRLLDLVIQSNPIVRVSLPGSGEFRLPGAGARADLLAATPLRYVLDDGVRSLCTKIMSDWPELLNPSDPALRLPVERLWIEWCRPGTSIVIGSRPQRCGVLVEADATGRRGRIESFWEDETFAADRAQVDIEFDLDRPLGTRTSAAFHFPFPNECDRALATHARISMDPGWADYFTFTNARHQPLARIAELCAENVWRDLPMMSSICPAAVRVAWIVPIAPVLRLGPGLA